MQILRYIQTKSISLDKAPRRYDIKKSPRRYFASEPKLSKYANRFIRDYSSAKQLIQRNT